MDIGYLPASVTIKLMAAHLSDGTSVVIPGYRIFSRERLLVVLGLFLLLILSLTFAWMTRDAMVDLQFRKRKAQGRADVQRTLVDLQPWQTAQALAGLAVTEEETAYAREAERLADHEVDQAFASALRQATTQPHAPTGEALTLSKKLAQLQQIVKEDQARVQSLTQAANLPASSTSKRSASLTPGDDLDVAKAQLGLDTDQLADAQRDYARAVGDERTKVQEELAAHESAMRTYDAQAGKEGAATPVSGRRYGAVAALLKAWIGQRNRYPLIQQAMQQAQADTIALTAEHNQLEREADAASSARAKGLSGPEANAASDLASAKAARIARLKNGSAERQLLGIYDDRIQAQQQLAVVYGKWSTQVLLQRRIVLHLLLRFFSLIIFILLVVIGVEALVRHLVNRSTLDRRRTHTLRTIFRLGIRCLGGLLILFVIFGAPSQMPTILGFTTAGLTLVLQDFIIAFFGWFVLMGKSGIRVGDWVEINGIGGEVVEIGLFRTAMLETGNWTAKGHPTGRRISFINSFAIKGQYFNFSTAGQWMWDEISIPASEDSYGMIELIHKAVLQETEKDAELAEEEWKRATRQNSMNIFTAGPTVNLRPSSSGIDIVVRYVTRASDRFEARNRLYRCVMDLLHRPGAARA